MTFIAVTSALTNKDELFNHVNASLPFRSARAVRHPAIVSFLDEFNARKSFSAADVDYNVRVEFLRAFPRWQRSSRMNRIKGLEAFPYLAYTHGTIQAFDAFHAEYRNRRFRCFKGEFMYHRAVWRHGYAFELLDDAPIERGDAVVVSLPFSDTGAEHPRMREVISECNRLDVPVLVDCAYMNIGTGIEIDIDQPCIKVLAFSLSKTFHGLDKIRIGVRFKREYSDDFVDVFNTADMVSFYGCACGLAFINHFDVDTNHALFRDRQLEICRELQVEPSDCVIFGLGDDRWSAYNRGGTRNRLCISSLLDQ